MAGFGLRSPTVIIKLVWLLFVEMTPSLRWSALNALPHKGNSNEYKQKQSVRTVQSKLVQECLSSIEIASRYFNISLVSVPGHSGIAGKLQSR